MAQETSKSFRTEVCGLVTASLFFGLVILDIVVVESVFRPSALWNEIWVWNIIFWTLIVALPIAVAIRMRSHLPLFIPLLVAFGLEDTAFYLLQLQLPMYYVGVSILGVWEPNREVVFMLNLLGMSIAVIIESVYLVSHFGRKTTWKGLRSIPGN